MRITRKGRIHDHGYYPVCSTTENFKVAIVNGHYSRNGRGSIRNYIRVDMDHDSDKKGGGVHDHLALITASDFAKIVNAVAEGLSRNKEFAEELAEAFGGNITALERLKLAALRVI